MEDELKTGLYGVAAEFGSPGDAVTAARRMKEAGYTHVEAYSPYPVEELSEALIKRRTRLPYLVFAGGLVGCLAGYGMQYYYHVYYYALNAGGRPYHSWPNFIPVTFELTILLAATTAVVGTILRNGLPKPYHPVFNVPRFDLASQDRFFLVVEATDPKFDAEEVRLMLSSLPATEVTDVAL